MTATAAWPTFEAALLGRDLVADRTMAFRFAKPADWSYRAGQFIDITLLDPLETDAEGNTRGFSISSAPDEDVIMITTRLRDTAFKRVLQAMPLGTAVRVEGPFGDLRLHHADRPAVVLTGGIGITPFRSILVQAVRDGGLPYRVVVFYGNRRPEDAAFLDELAGLAQQDSNLTFVPAMSDMSKSEREWAGELGHRRVDAAPPSCGRRRPHLLPHWPARHGPRAAHDARRFRHRRGRHPDRRIHRLLRSNGTMRLDYRHELPEASRALSELERVVEASTLEPKLRELVKLRASQINGCAYCVDMHTKDAQAMGEDPQRLHLVAVWREAPVFNPRERAALAWTESLTLLPQTGAPDDVYAEMAREFDPTEQVALTLAIVAINGWNRLAVGFRQPVGAYVSHHRVAA